MVFRSILTFVLAPRRPLPIRPIAAGTVVLGIVAPVLSQTAYASESAPALSPDQAVTEAIRRNPRLSAAARQVAAAEYGVRSAGALANPEVIFTPGITSLGGTGEELLVQQPLELNGARSARTGVARAEAKATHAAAVVELRRLAFETRLAYYELYRARELHQIAVDLVKSAEEFDRIASRQVEVGARPGIDQTQTAIQVSQARQQLALAEARIIQSTATLNTLMGRAPEEELGALAPPEVPPLNLDRDTLIATALESRAEINIEAAEQQAFQQQAKLARAEGRPDLAPQFRAGSLVRGVRDAGIGLAVTLPLFDYGQRRNRIRQAEENARAQEDRLAAVRNQVRQEVEQAIARLSAIDAVVRNYQRDLLEPSRRVLDATQVGFRSGFASITAVLEAQRTYRSVLTEYTNAVVEHALARAELEWATGSIPAERLSQTSTQEGDTP